MIRRVTAFALAGVLSTGVAACSGDDEADDETVGTTSTTEATTTSETTERTTTTRPRTTTSSTTTSTTAAPITTTTVAPAEAVLRDYRAGWAAYLDAGRVEPANPDAPAFLDLHRDAALTNSRDILVQIRDDGNLLRGDYEFRPVVASIEGAEAVVYDCLTDHVEEFDIATGTVEFPPVAEPIGREYRLRLEGDRWRTRDIFERPESCAS